MSQQKEQHIEVEGVVATVLAGTMFRVELENKHMVLAVRGQPGTKADQVHFDSLRIDGKVLTVAWKVKQRPPHAGPGTPIAIILVDRFDGEVKFGP